MGAIIIGGMEAVGEQPNTTDKDEDESLGLLSKMTMNTRTNNETNPKRKEGESIHITKELPHQENIERQQTHESARDESWTTQGGKQAENRLRKEIESGSINEDP